MIKSRGPKDMVWDSSGMIPSSGEDDLPTGTPRFWVCANCRSTEPVEKITLIGKMPLCEECCGTSVRHRIPAGGVDEIIDRILAQGREDARARRKGRHPKSKRRSKESETKN